MMIRTASGTAQQRAEQDEGIGKSGGRETRLLFLLLFVFFPTHTLMPMDDPHDNHADS